MLEPTDLSDHTTFLKRQSASGYAAELHGLHMTTALSDHPPLQTRASLLTALRQLLEKRNLLNSGSSTCS